MSNELQEIKKIYGETMSHLCRELFPTLLETEGLLLQILKSKFAPNKSLAQDIIAESVQEEFKSYIYSFIDVEKNNEPISLKKPDELLKEAGYILYECRTEEDIQYFKKYYRSDEELCTFYGGRLNRCHVFFAVKENVDQIKREDFGKPNRQDEYGTSVISIQFTRDSSHTLSIKNRYNHTVNNPDATFSNNLDNIIPGLTDSFAREGYEQAYSRKNFDLPSYVLANDGKFYKYKFEMSNIYYCSNNIIIDNFEVHEYNKNSYLIFDYFILDLKQKQILLYDKNLDDSFIDGLSDIKNISIQKDGNFKKIIIKPNIGEDIIITIDREQNLRGYKDVNVRSCGNGFLKYVFELTTIDVPNLESCGDGFLSNARNLTTIDVSNLERCGNSFLSGTYSLTTMDVPNLERCGNDFLSCAVDLTKIDVSNLKRCGDYFLYHASKLTTMDVPNLKSCGNAFLGYALELTTIDVPNLESCGDGFLSNARNLTTIDVSNLERCGNSFLSGTYSLTTINAPNLNRNDYISFQERQQEPRIQPVNDNGLGLFSNDEGRSR